MRRIAILACTVILGVAAAHAATVQSVLTPVRSQVKASDYRATGQLVRVDGNGNRTRYSVSVKGLWFGGGLHTLVDIVPSKQEAGAAREEHVRVLLETRADGRDSIQVFRARQSGAGMLPFDKWQDGLAGAAFSYEDLLESQYFWPGQEIAKTAVFDGHTCDVLKSTPGPRDRTHYASVQTWLDQKIDYPVYAEKVMKNGGAEKDFTYFGLRKSSGVWAATQIEVKIRGRAGSTLLIIKRGSAKAHLTASDFSPEKISHFEDRP